MNSIARVFAAVALWTGLLAASARAMASTADIRLESGPVRSTPGDDHAPQSFPQPEASANGQLRIGQSFAEVRAILQAHNPPARLIVESRRYQFHTARSEPNVVAAVALITSPDRGMVETLRLRFTSKLTGQRLYFIHRDVEFRRAADPSVAAFLDRVTMEFRGSTWSLAVPGYLAYRQVFAGGRMLSWSETQRQPELAGCFLLSGAPGLERTFEDTVLAAPRQDDTAICGAGVDADWRGDLRRFTVTTIDFPLYRDDRRSLRGSLQAPPRPAPPP